MKEKKIIIFSIILLLILSFGYTVYSSSPLVSHELNKGNILKNYKSNNEVVAIVNGEQIFKRDYLYQLEDTKYGIQKMKSLKENNKALTLTGTKLLEIQNKYNPKTIAFASLLEKTALVSKAKNLGFNVDTEVQEKVNFAQKEEKPPEIQAFIKEIGEKYYYEEYIPRVYAKYVLISKLKQEQIRKNKDWHEYRYSLANQAKVTILDKELLQGATREKALQYLKEYMNLMQKDTE